MRGKPRKHKNGEIQAVSKITESKSARKTLKQGDFNVGSNERIKKSRESEAVCKVHVTIKGSRHRLQLCRPHQFSIKTMCRPGAPIN